jgi:hypothetical protein
MRKLLALPPAERKREAVRKTRDKYQAQGRRQISVYISVEAVSALDRLCGELGLDRGRALDALLLGQVKAKKSPRIKKAQPIDTADLLDVYRLLEISF